MSEAPQHVCPKCGEEFRMAYVGYPPEPYGDVCGCPDDDYADARADTAGAQREHLTSGFKGFDQ